MLQQALQKLQKEIGDKAKDSIVQHIGSYMLNYVRSHPEHAAFVLADGKDISGSYKFMEAEARKASTRVMTDQEGFNLVLKYFGIPVQEAKPVSVIPELNASLDDLI